MPRWFWPGLVILAMLVGGWFGWQQRQLLRYQATAHQSFVDEFQNGIRGAYSDVESARRALEHGNASLAAVALGDVENDLRLMWLGANGMSIGRDGYTVSLTVVGRYQSEANMLQGQLLTGATGGDVQTRLDDLSHDMTLLLQQLGDHAQRDWLAHATPAEFSVRYQEWRQQALIKPDVP
ncbi:MAG: hypothetical protein ACM3XM_00530 [Mycobacterium leprae]